MARLGVDYETVKQTAVKLLSQGAAPSVQKIREALGTGSNTTIAEHLKVWREEYAKKAIHHLPANMPKELISVFEVLWQTAMEQAQNQLAEYKQAVDSKCQAALHAQQDAEKCVIDSKQKMAELSSTLEQEIADKHKVNTELAVISERLIKQDQAFDSQGNQYEERLKRAYDEKDKLETQYQQLHNEAKILQEKLSLQAQKHQNSLNQQITLHEQSENRWLSLIDRAKQEVKDAYKKCDAVNKHSNEEIKKLNAALADFQQNYFEKNAQLNTAQERIAQLKKEIKFLDAEYLKARATIIQLEKKKKSIRNLDENKHEKEKRLKSKTKIPL